MSIACWILLFIFEFCIHCLHYLKCAIDIILFLTQSQCLTLLLQNRCMCNNAALRLSDHINAHVHISVTWLYDLVHASLVLQSAYTASNMCALAFNKRRTTGGPSVHLSLAQSEDVCLSICNDLWYKLRRLHL